jgi:hypothetical protein
MRTIAFIAGCGHSGSTLLELILSRHPKCAGVGEAFQLTQPIDCIERLKSYWTPNGEVARRCSCGSELNTCPFWGGLVNDWREAGPMTRKERYASILKNFESIYPERDVVVDSSKTVAALQLLRHISPAQLRIVHLIRDVRGYTVSMQKSYRRHNEAKLTQLIRARGLKGSFRWLQHTQVANFEFWYRTNRHLERFASAAKIPYLQVSYEDLCFSPSKVLSTVCDFLDVRFFSGMLESLSSEGHIFIGNRLKNSRERQSNINYDLRWVFDQAWILPAAVLPWITKYSGERCKPNVFKESAD